jgi:hypothetical protein
MYYVRLCIFFYTRRRRRRSVAGSTRAIGVMKYRGPSRDVLVFFLSYLSLLFRRTTRLPQPPPPPPRGREAHNKGNATRFDFERARSRHLTPWPTDRPTGQGRVRPEFARRDANTQIIRVYYYYYYFYYQ